jgi:hypothetical protein
MTSIKDIERIKHLTDLFNNCTITPQQKIELDELQREWLLNSDIADDDFDIHRNNLERSNK